MAGKNHHWPDFIPKLPGWITGFITFVSTVVGFIKLWQGDASLVTIVLLVVGTGGGILGCAYVAFKRTPPMLDGSRGTWQYPRWRRWAQAGLVMIPLLTAGGVGYRLYWPPAHIILLVANFDGPEPQKYRLTETVLARLRQALEKYDDVKIETLGRAITEVDGSAVARAEGKNRKAAIVIWGWYGATAEAVLLSAHFELLRPPEYMLELGPEAKGQARAMSLAEFESFTLQARLSAEMAYLSLSTVGMARYAVGDWDGAIARFSDALSQTSEPIRALDQSIVYGHRGIAYMFKRADDRAFADFNHAIALNPDYAPAYLMRGVNYVAQGEYDRAIADFDQLINLRPPLAEAYFVRGAVYGIYKHEYDRAIADFDHAIKLNPNDAFAYFYRGNASAAKGDHDRAIADFDHAIGLKPDLTEAYLNRGIAYTDKGEHDRAAANFDQAIELMPDFAEVYFNRGNAHLAKGDTDRAIADFDRAIALKPGYAAAYINRGHVYAVKGDDDRAIADFDQAIKLTPDRAVTYFNRGNIYARKGDPDRAIADFNQSINLKPDDPQPYYNRGQVYKSRGETEKAIADFKKFLELSNDLQWRKLAEEQLKALGAW
jgi:tetratricopeptide (TPR) repeat protein